MELNAVTEQIKLCKHNRGEVVAVLQRHGDGSIHFNHLKPAKQEIDAFCSLEQLEAFYREELHTVPFRLPPTVLEWPCSQCVALRRPRKITDFFRRD